MSAILAYIITYDRLPALDSQGRPEMFYGKRVHDQCYRRAHFDAGEYVESWDDEGARSGLCLYKMGCKGPTTYNACPATRWNNGVSFPIQSGHGCIGCSEQNFWDQGSFYDRITTIPHFGTNATAETVVWPPWPCGRRCGRARRCQHDPACPLPRKKGRHQRFNHQYQRLQQLRNDIHGLRIYHARIHSH